MTGPGRIRIPISPETAPYPTMTADRISMVVESAHLTEFFLPTNGHKQQTWIVHDKVRSRHKKTPAPK